MAKRSLADLERLGYSKVAPDDHRIALNADGSCEFRSFWNFSSAKGGSPLNDYISDAEGCSWRLESSDELLWSKRQVVGQVTFDINRLVDGTPMFTEVTLQLEERSGDDILVASIGHPDDGRLLEYVRPK